MMNSVRARPKKSTLERDTGRRVITTFILLLLICLTAGFAYATWESKNQTVVSKYLMHRTRSWTRNVLIRMGNWVLIFGNFVPISLLITLETVKFMQGHLISIDQGLVAKNGIDCKVQSSSLNEELGQVEYVFSDKTGTLTCNEMRFKYLVVGDQVYGERRGYTSTDLPFVKNVDFEDPLVWEKKENGFATEDCKRLRDAIMLLGLCHNVVVEDNGDFNASSPDELAFVSFAKLVGCDFKGMDADNFIMIKEFDKEKKYRLLETFEFNSDRKRMSCIVRSEDSGQILMLTKGADNIMIPRLHKDRKHQFHKLSKHVEEFAAIGLRTLVLAQKSMTQDEYTRFKKDYDVGHEMTLGCQE